MVEAGDGKATGHGADNDSKVDTNVWDMLSYEKTFW
jgi:hypothetical protein